MSVPETEPWIQDGSARSPLALIYIKGVRAVTFRNDRKSIDVSITAFCRHNRLDVFAVDNFGLPAEERSVGTVLGALDLLSTLDQDQIDALATQTHRRELKRGEHLFHAQTPAESFFVLRTGQVKLFVLSHQGEEKVLGLVEAGDTFAEGVAFMDEPRYPVSAQALTACEVWAISTAAMRALLSRSFPTCLKLLARQTQRIQGLLAEVEAHALESAHHRLIAYLLRQAESGDTLTLPASKTLIAAHLAIKPETLSRLLAELQRRGLIEMHERNIRLRDRDALLDLSLEPVLRSL